MFLIRSAEPRDFQALALLAQLLNSYNFPADRDFLRELLRDSQLSFLSGSISEARRRFLIVAEEVRTGKVVGCSLILARHGTGAMPHLSFRVGFEQKKSRTLKRTVKHKILQLSVNRSGFTEIGGLVVLPAYRHREERLAAQLSYVRFAYMACHPRAFRPKVLVEYLPRLDSGAGNEFWQALGARFTDLTYGEADRLSIHSKEFILSLFPKEKIYCTLLPKGASRNIGVPGPGAEASLHMLSKIGFRYLNQVDPFDAGPHYGALRRDISIVKATGFFRYQAGGKMIQPKNTKTALVMTTKKGLMRAVLTTYQTKGNLIHLNPKIAALLRLREAERVSVTSI